MYMYKTEFNHNRQIDLVKEKISWTGRSEDMYCSSEAIYDLCTSHLKMNLMTEECVICICLDSALHLTGYFTVASGTVNICPVTPREIFIKALMSGSVGIVLVHNHPSGISSPSETDVLLTQRVVKSGEIIGITVWDHMIIGDGQYYSFREQSPEILEVA